MNGYRVRRLPGVTRLEVSCRGAELLAHPMLNKGTAFTRAERDLLGLRGLLPDAVSTLEEQAERAWAHVEARHDDLGRYMALAALQDRNEHVYHRVLADHLDELLPVVYPPVASSGEPEFARSFRRVHGVWITPADRGRVAEALANAAAPEARVVVVGDSERVFGVGGDDSAGLAGPMGTVALCTAAGGIHPSQILGVTFDVGTDSEAQLSDPLYFGCRHPRLRGADYEGLVEELVAAIHKRHPDALLLWEGFGEDVALGIVDRFRRLLPTVNREVHGTAVLAVAAALVLEKAGGTPLSEQRFLVCGSGSTAVATGRLLRDALFRRGAAGTGLAERIAMVGADGLLVQDGEAPELAWPAELAARHGLLPGARGADAVARALRPTTLVVAGPLERAAEGVVRAVAEGQPQPVILSLAPDGPAAADILVWTRGQARVVTAASGRLPSWAEKSFGGARAHSALVFPGLALGAVVARAREVTEGMLRAAAEAIAAEVRDPAETLLPRPVGLRGIARRVAHAVVREARDTGAGLPLDTGAIGRLIGEAMWDPAYPELLPVETPAPRPR